MIYSILFPIQDFLQLYNIISDWTPGEDQVLSFHSKVQSSRNEISVLKVEHYSVSIWYNRYKWQRKSRFLTKT